MGIDGVAFDSAIFVVTATVFSDFIREWYRVISINDEIRRLLARIRGLQGDIDKLVELNSEMVLVNDIQVLLDKSKAALKKAQEDAEK